ncbi:Fe2+-dependent dioxygenase [Roseateles puraquae]|uniref:Fe2+-dependent dioxygenase n=1 Tax=Roseateles puraquae TaxID=431059 RepID=A0A254N579_9BURK|nr:Fe2+-dependent dioxygenase [Roseateles puraquae]MDG0855872.1 Fe2+-dependent dioxygenase [Roseateles puraquae]MDG0855913.1 Fe2+-dependent dioxygenase [Roseateles puraquae]OWR03211.1 Fe2+-dependent dioxygenase [Roseateles puraquae]
MLLKIPQILDADGVARARALLAAAPWSDGRSTAGRQAAQVKNNEQLSPGSDQHRELQALVLQALDRHPLFFSATLPKRVLPPQFNRYGGATNTYGNHVDQAVRYLPGGTQRVRTDISCTLFLSDPADYDGGDLVIDTTFGEQRVKLAAGDMVVYPGTSVHRVEPVTRGARLASFFWIESMVRGDEQRRLLYEMDMSLMALRTELGETPELVQITGTYHNLLRMWADT